MFLKNSSYIYNQKLPAYTGSFLKPLIFKGFFTSHYFVNQLKRFGMVIAFKKKHIGKLII